MSEGTVVNIGREALYTILLLAAPVLGLSLVVGLVVSIFQAATQIQEQTLAFIPKILAVFVAVVLFGPWMLKVMLDYSTRLLGSMNTFVR